MEKIRARHRGHKNIYVHNDLSNAAYQYKKMIEAKLKADDRVGIYFLYLGCLLMLAFTCEAYINFLGHKLIRNWKERQPFNDKVTEILTHLKINPDWTVRPFSSIKQLKNFRDSIAHGKPVETEFDEIVETPNEEIDRLTDLDAEWVKYCGHDDVFNTYDDVDVIWEKLLAQSDLTIVDTITHGTRRRTFIEKIVET